MRAPANGHSPKLRCVIYTRVSSDSGLEQEFNSLDNQREAGEAYVRSQAHEGWTLKPTRYDDGGFSGGSLERPAVKQLLADIEARLIDIVVVYKVDRLTRSLADFARLVELFDANGVSFVSVTQAFNTTNSMGRLTLNVLLSFAQFEREVTGERIRDKIAASKKTGLWMGGHVPLGYRIEARKLLIDAAEANQVRRLFERYIALRSIPALVEILRTEGFVTRVRTLTGGRTIGGIPLTNGPLHAILTNRVYLGEITHKGKTFPGEHEPIIDPTTFNTVQTILATNRTHRAERWRSSGAILMGRIFDDRGNVMTPGFSVKNGARYRYYVSSAIPQGRRQDAGSVARVPADEIERLVIARLSEHRRANAYPVDPAFDGTASASAAASLIGGMGTAGADTSGRIGVADADTSDAVGTPDGSDTNATTDITISPNVARRRTSDMSHPAVVTEAINTDDRPTFERSYPADVTALSEVDLIAAILDRVVVTAAALELHLKSGDTGHQDEGSNASDTERKATPSSILTIPWRKPPIGRRRHIIFGAGSDETAATVPPIRAEARARLLTAIAKARHWLDQLITGDMASTDTIAAHNKISERSVRNTLTLAFLAPDLVKAIIDGTLPHGAGLVALADAPADWAEQAALFMPKQRANRRVGDG